MRICFLGMHDFQPVKAFYTYVYNENKEYQTARNHWTGHACTGCKKRKLIYKADWSSTGSPGEQQAAYDWLHGVEREENMERLPPLHSNGKPELRIVK